MDFSFISAWQDANQKISLISIRLSADFSIALFKTLAEPQNVHPNINIAWDALTKQKLLIYYNILLIFFIKYLSDNFP